MYLPPPWVYTPYHSIYYMWSQLTASLSPSPYWIFLDYRATYRLVVFLLYITAKFYCTNEWIYIYVKGLSYCLANNMWSIYVNSLYQFYQSIVGMVVWQSPTSVLSAFNNLDLYQRTRTFGEQFYLEVSQMPQLSLSQPQ